MERLPTATCTISIDLELAWGDKGKPRYDAQHEGERAAIAGFLALCDTYDVPATWATVGNLFLRDRHELSRYGVELVGRGVPAYREWITEHRNHFWFGRDIIEAILDARATHEIASHTFFHTLVSEIDEAGYEYELRETRRVAREAFGLDLTSFVYPRNEGGYMSALSRAGYTHVRGPDVHLATVPKRIRPVARVWNEFTARPITPVFPVRTPEGLWSLPGSYFFPMVIREGVRAPMGARVHKCCRGIDRAIETGGNIHLWFHPHNFGTETAYWLSGMEAMMRYVRQQCDAGKLRVAVMRDLV